MTEPALSLLEQTCHELKENLYTRAILLFLKEKASDINKHLPICLWHESCEAPVMLNENDSSLLWVSWDFFLLKLKNA